jgi:hypothetical protein
MSPSARERCERRPSERALYQAEEQLEREGRQQRDISHKTGKSSRKTREHRCTLSLPYLMIRLER